MILPHNLVQVVIHERHLRAPFGLHTLILPLHRRRNASPARFSVDKKSLLFFQKLDILQQALDKKEQGQGIGKALIRDALLRIVNAADIIGGRAVLVNAKDSQAKRFYEDLGFEPSPIDPLHLYLLIKDVKKTLGL
ncbi:MAG: GNAT family N-acetyltransferase [Candidatus Omnitrophica bacterium]|nr:GNAT family N-acetyltransferase [Candidatus Omnitrophota bacterium]